MMLKWKRIKVRGALAIPSCDGPDQIQGEEKQEHEMPNIFAPQSVCNKISTLTATLMFYVMYLCC